MTSAADTGRPILVTGGTGQVGFELGRQLSEFATVVCPTSAELNLLEPENVRSYISSLKPGLIINAAAHTGVDLCETEKDKAKILNEDAASLLAAAAQKLNAGLIHYSTDYVFDGAKSTPYTESDQTNPLSVYGLTKFRGEQAIQASGVPAIILRCQWVYSKRGKNFLLTMLRLGAERKNLSIVADQQGSPTWAREIARATAKIVSSAYDSKSGSTGFIAEHSGVYHMAASGSTSWFGFAEAIFDRTVGEHPCLTPITTAEYPTPAKRPANSVFDTTKLTKTFGVSLLDWRTGLDQAMSTEA